MKNKMMKRILSVENYVPSHKMNYDLQFFASDKNDDDKDNDDANDNDNDNDDSGDDDNDDSDKGGNENSDKKFTQDDMTKLATKEKKQGRRSAFREMGFKDELDAKKQLDAFHEWQKSQLSEDEKHQQELDTANTATSEAEKRAKEAEEKLAVVIAGVRKDSIDDVLAIARGKVTDDKSLDDVLSAMKKEDKYKSFFVSEDSGSGTNKGTGSGLGHKKNTKKEDNLGARLAKQQMSGRANKKSSYFN
jgi:hypothetical protein